MRTLFFGSGEFSAISLRALLGNSTFNYKNKYSVHQLTRNIQLDVVVPVSPSSSSLQTNPVKSIAISNNLRLFEYTPQFLDNILKSREKYDLGVVVSFGYFLPETLIDSFSLGTLNVHPSLLPKYRGAAPIQHAIINGDWESGVSIIDLDKRVFDAGNIMDQVKYEIPEYAHYDTVERELAVLGAHSLLNVISNLDYYKSVAIRQSDILSGVPVHLQRAPKIRRRMARVNVGEQSATTIYRLYAAISHQYPLYTTLFKSSNITVVNNDNCCEYVLSSLLTPVEVRRQLGLVERLDPRIRLVTESGVVFMNSITNTLFIHCATNSDKLEDRWLGVKRVSVSSKPPFSAQSFFEWMGWSNFDRVI